MEEDQSLTRSEDAIYDEYEAEVKKRQSSSSMFETKQDKSNDTATYKLKKIPSHPKLASFDTDEWNVFCSDARGLVFSYPSWWHVKQSHGAVELMYANDAYIRPTIEIKVLFRPTSVRVTMYDTVNMIKKAFGIEDLDVYKMSLHSECYTVKLDVERDGFDITYVYMWFVQFDKQYLVGCSCLTSQYNKFKPIFTKVLSSIRAHDTKLYWAHIFKIYTNNDYGFDLSLPSEFVRIDIPNRDPQEGYIDMYEVQNTGLSHIDISSIHNEFPLKLAIGIELIETDPNTYFTQLDLMLRRTVGATLTRFTNTNEYPCRICQFRSDKYTGNLLHYTKGFIFIDTRMFSFTLSSHIYDKRSECIMERILQSFEVFPVHKPRTELSVHRFEQLKYGYGFKYGGEEWVLDASKIHIRLSKHNARSTEIEVSTHHHYSNITDAKEYLDSFLPNIIEKVQNYADILKADVKLVSEKYGSFMDIPTKVVQFDLVYSKGAYHLDQPLEMTSIITYYRPRPDSIIILGFRCRTRRLEAHWPLANEIFSSIYFFKKR